MEEEIAKGVEIRVVKVQDLLSRSDDPLEWLIERIIPTQSITVISGDPGNFKTWLSLEIAKCVANKQELFGKFPTQQKKVLIVDRENRSNHVRIRLQQNKTPPESEIYFLSNESFFLDREEDFEALLKKMRELGIGLVIFDSLVRIHSGDENSSRDMAVVSACFQRIAKEKISVIFLHHLKKGSREGKAHEAARGSSEIHAAVDCHLRIERLGEKPLLKIEQLKLRQDEEIKPFLVEIRKEIGTKNVEFVYVEAYDKNKEERNQAKSAIRDLYDQDEKRVLTLKSAIELLKEESFKKPIVDAALKELVSDGHLELERGKSNKFTYSLKMAQPRTLEQDESVENLG